VQQCTQYRTKIQLCAKNGPVNKEISVNRADWAAEHTNRRAKPGPFLTSGIRRGIKPRDFKDNFAENSMCGIFGKNFTIFEIPGFNTSPNPGGSKGPRLGAAVCMFRCPIGPVYSPC